MKIFSGTSSGASSGAVYYDNRVTVGSIALPVEQNPPGSRSQIQRDGRLDNASLRRDEKGKLRLMVGSAESFSEGGVEFSQDAAIVIFDTHLIAIEDFVLAAKSGVCAAPFAESRVYIASAIQSPAACIYHRFHGVLVMEPGSVFELKESYMRFALLDWIDRLRGRIQGHTRFTVRQLISYDGRSVQIEKLPTLTEVVPTAKTN